MWFFEEILWFWYIFVSDFQMILSSMYEQKNKSIAQKRFLCDSKQQKIEKQFFESNAIHPTRTPGAAVEGFCQS